MSNRPSPAPLSERQRWDARYAEPGYRFDLEPAGFLVQHASALPKGRALCLAAGEGRNAVYLAGLGFRVTAVDISPVGLRKCAARAGEAGVTLATVVADLETWSPGRERWDLITNFMFYSDRILDRVQDALRPGGRFIFQTFSTDNPAISDRGPKNPAMLARPNDLLSRFPALRVRHYEDAVFEREDGGRDAMIRFVAEKPARL